MTVKEKIFCLFRSSERELNEECMRLKDAMDKEDPTSIKYGTLLERYDTLVARRMELIKFRTEIDKAVVGGLIGIGGLLVYRKMIDSAEEPFFKDLGKILLKVGIH